MYTRPFTVHSYSKRKEKEREQEEAKKNVGTFTTKETRNEVAKEIKRTHFHFGSEGGQFPQSLSKDTYQNVQVGDKNIMNQQKKMAKINKKSNFIFGNDPSKMDETTSNQAYNQKQFSDRGNSNTFSVNTLRKGNFRLGFNNENMYETTAQSNFTNKNDEFHASRPSMNKSDKKSNLTSMYGYSKPSYQTTNNSNFTEKDVTASFKDKHLMKQRGTNLKQANFSFGHFNNAGSLNTIPTEAVKNSNKYHTDLEKQSQIAKQRGLELKKSNFKFSEKNKADDKKSTFKSMAQLQFDEENFKGDNVAQMNNLNKEMSNNLKKDLRSSHFHFGNNESNSQSASHDAHGKFNIDPKGKEESTKLAKKMQSAHFSLGDKKQAGIPLRSTYKDSISAAQNFQNMPRENACPDSKKTTIDIGKGKSMGYTSEAKEKFAPHGQVSKTMDREAKQKMEYLKQNHFALGVDKNDFGTVNKLDYGAKPTLGYKKYQSDIQKTSFVIGFQGNPFSAQTPSGGASALTDRQRPSSQKRSPGDMAKSTSSTKAGNANQRENFRLGQNGGDFRTMNQAYYRWIQPKGDR
jgi:hypothetical protein